MAERRNYSAMIRFGAAAAFVWFCMFMSSASADMGSNRSVNKGGSPVTRDGSGLSAITNQITARQIADWVFCNCTNVDNSFDALRGVGILTPGSTINLVNGVGGYTMSRVPHAGAFPASVALFGMGIADINGSAVWGINTALSDNRGQTISTGAGRSLQNELDLNFTSGSTIGTGLIVGGKSLIQPAAATGITVATLDQNNGLTARWNQAYATVDGATDNFALIASKAANGGSTTADGQALVFFSYLSGAQKIKTIYLGSDGDFRATAGMHVDTGVFLHIYTVAQLTSAYTCNGGNEGLLASVSDANSATFNATLVGGGSNHVMAYCNGTNFTVH